MASAAAFVLFVVFTMATGFYFPGSYQKYMDDSRALFRPSAPLPQLKPYFQPAAGFLPNTDGPEAEQLPRRTLRQFHEVKRMRPCFYSPIQCLMKRSEP